MRILFAHQNFPGQYRHLLRLLVEEGGHEIVFLTQRANETFPGVRKIIYKTHREPHSNTHPYLKRTEDAVLRGQAVARTCMSLKKSGFIPDVMLGHNGWGETLYLKDVFPDTPLNTYFEFYYGGKNSDSDFDPEFPTAPDAHLRVRTWNAVNLMGLEAADAGQTPTLWQKSRYPTRYHELIQVCHEGVDTDRVIPNPEASVKLPSSEVLDRHSDVVTFVARNLEPYRGFHIFMRALVTLLERRPGVRVLIVGADGVSYGQRLPKGQTYKQRMLAELQGKLDLQRIAFLGHLPYERYLEVLQISKVHVYLTYPFVLSWSLMEAMSAGCVVVGSATGPLEEIIKDGQNGFLTDFFDIPRLVERIEAALASQDSLQSMRVAARRSIVEKYDLKRICLPFHRGMIRKMVDDGHVSGRSTPTWAAMSS